MIVLDTNVISEAMKPMPHPDVRAWLNDQAAESLYLTSVTLAELAFGVGILPAGRKKNRLAGILEGLPKLFAGRILTFDADAAWHYAALAVQARRDGLGFPLPDGYIAAIAASRNFAVATRDTRPFEAAGLTVINPWDAAR